MSLLLLHLPFLPFGTPIKALTHSPPLSLCLLTSPSASCVNLPPWCCMLSSLGVCRYNKLFFQWQSSLDLLATPYLKNNKTCILNHSSTTSNRGNKSRRLCLVLDLRGKALNLSPLRIMWVFNICPLCWKSSLLVQFVEYFLSWKGVRFHQMIFSPCIEIFTQSFSPFILLMQYMTWIDF